MDQIKETLKDWLCNVHRLHHAHNRCVTHFSRVHFWLGVPAIFFATLAGGSGLGSLSLKFSQAQAPAQEVASLVLTNIAATSALVSAVLSAIQGFVRSQERSQEHVQAATEYGALRRELQQKASIGFSCVEFDKFASEFSARWNEVNRIAPPIPDRIYSAVRKVVTEELQEKYVGTCV